MEDTQDKVRRNLVVFSAAIAIGWFLDLKLTAITKLFVSTSDINNVDVGKLWAVALVVLIYLFLRYRFDANTNLQLAELSDELEKIRKTYLSKYLFRKIAKINRSGEFLPVFGTFLMDRVNQEIEKLKEEYSHEIIFRLHMSSPWSEESPIDSDESKTLWGGTVGIAEEYLKAGSSRSLILSSGMRHDFSIPLIGRVWVRAHSIIHVVSYSKSAVDLILPMALSGFALCIVIGKLVAIYLI